MAPSPHALIAFGAVVLAAAVGATAGAAPRAPQPPGPSGPAVATTAPTPPVTATTLPAPPLAPGSAGAAVRNLQARLVAAGLQTARAPTGTYDDETAHAVTALQKLRGLPRTGVADAATVAALDEPLGVTPRLAAPGLHVEVDLARQVSVVVEDGRATRVYDSSTGAPASPTPAGDFYVRYSIDGWRYARLGPLWRPVYFTADGIAFHGGEPVLPEPASHGCVRLTDPAMDELFPRLVPGTRVVVFS